MIHILLPVHNRIVLTERFSNSLLKQRSDDYRLLLVDDGSADGTADRVVAIIPREKLQIIRGDGNLWWAGALQKAYQTLQSMASPDDAVLIANDDMDFEDDFLEKGLVVLSENPKAAIQAMGVDREKGFIDRGAVADLVNLRFYPAKEGEKANCLSTRGLLMKVSTFNASGGFRPRLLPHYLSDYEFSLRLARKGVPLLCDSRFQASIFLELTGLGTYNVHEGMAVFLKEAFSYRAKYNPLHWSIFVFMTCSLPRAILHAFRIWGGFFLAGAKTVFPARRAIGG